LKTSSRLLPINLLAAVFEQPVYFSDSNGGVLIVSSLSGYAFARINFKGRNFLFMLLLSSLMMPPEVTIIPNYLIMNRLGWTNTHIPLIIIPILGAGGVFATFMMRQFFISLPKDMEDAAKIDGLGWWGIFWKIGLHWQKPLLRLLQ
jgi:multiple sugar transport system permease protein